MTSAWHDGAPQPFADVQSEEVRDNLATAHSHAADEDVPFSLIGMLWYNSSRREFNTPINGTFSEGFSPIQGVAQFFDDFNGWDIQSPPWTYSEVGGGTHSIVEEHAFGTVLRLLAAVGATPSYAEISLAKAQFWFGYGTGLFTTSTMDPRMVAVGRMPSTGGAQSVIGFRSNYNAFVGFVAGLSSTLIARVTDGAGTVVEEDTGLSPSSGEPYMFEITGGTFSVLRIRTSFAGNYDGTFLSPGLTHFFYPHARAESLNGGDHYVDLDFVRVAGKRPGSYF